MGFFEKIVIFFKEVRFELKKVTWPTRQEAIKHTIAVVFVTLAVAVFLGAADLLFQWLINTFIL
jgi:preprotein translocase subunit SecE